LTMRAWAPQRHRLDALANNLCRCGAHARIVKAVMRAAGA